jgi:hypothetical protein
LESIEIGGDQERERLIRKENERKIKDGEKMGE